MIKRKFPSSSRQDHANVSKSLHETQMRFGNESQPGIDMNALLSNEFQYEYIRKKISYDDNIEVKKAEEKAKSKILKNVQEIK